MVTIESIIAHLEASVTDYAVAGLAKPQGRDAFEYGFVAGRVRGLAMAREIIEKLLEADETNESLKESRS
jgi:hypothetical protein